MLRSLKWRLGLPAVLATVGFAPLLAAELKPDYHPAAYAIVGATIGVGPESTIANGTVVVRDGMIAAVGPSGTVAVPADAETIEGRGLFVYPGFLDLYTTLGQPLGVVRSQTGAGRSIDWNDHVLARTPTDDRTGLTPEFEVAKVFELPEAVVEDRRKLGFTDLLAAPFGAIATGQSALVSLSGLTRREVIVQAPVALHVNARPPFDPTNPNGASDAWAYRPPPKSRAHDYPLSMMGAVAHLRQAMLDAEYHHRLHAHYAKHGGPRPAFDPTLDALYAARTKALPVWWEANTRDEVHRALDLAEEFGTTAVIVGGRDAGQVADRLKALDVPVVLRLDFPDEPKVPTADEYRQRDLIDRETPLKVYQTRHDRWRERVETPATLARAGVRFAFASDGLSKPETFPAQLRKVIAAGLPLPAAVDALTRRAAEIAGLGSRLGTIAPGKVGHLVALSGPLGDEATKVRYVIADGLKFDIKKDEAKRAARDEPGKVVVKEKPGDAPKAEPAPAPATTLKDKDPKPDAPPFVDVAVELAATRRPRIHTGGNVLIQNATILTVTRGTIPAGSILVRNGKIAAVGAIDGAAVPKGTTVIDATGLVAMPGIIDTHSHIAIQGNINEPSVSITSEVRVRDVVNGDDPDIYRALAGGTTTARLLHGSTNPIGGQDAVIKLKHGQAARDLIIKDAPRGIKFALGENVTTERGRFPNTRMGVEATLDRAFLEARAYAELWKAYETEKALDPTLLPPRRDLRLEALAGVLDGAIKVHCHCYRDDEILMLLQLAARHGFKVQSLHHASEGYKVAAEIALSGASVSSFSDWWAFKVEALDAIPYNAALLTRAGTSVCIKSDSEELMRHLNLEAAKMVKYGDVTEAQALAMITLNPARELGLEDRLGALEPGKDADIALFNAHPFDAFSRCELTLIDGEVWFQRPESSGTFAARPGAHAVMPAPSQGLRDRNLEIQTNPRGVYALVGATLHPVTGPAIADGTLVVADGRIAAIGGAETRIPGAAQTIDVQGFDVWPGLIDAGTPLGLFEVGSLNETLDFAEIAQFQPELRASSALRAESALIPATRANGILTAYVQPTGGVISGQGCIIELNGWVPRELLLADSIALNVNIRDYVPHHHYDYFRPRAPDPLDPKQKRKERLDAIRELFRRSLIYDKVVDEARAGRVKPPLPDPRLAALAPYAKGLKPVIFNAEQRPEILDSLELAEDLHLKAVISGGIDAWQVADALKAAHVPVLLNGTLQSPPDEHDPYDAPYANPARLFEAGVAFAIRSKDLGPDQATAARNLPYEAATAVAFGLPEDEALKAVTLYPARILGIDDQVGALEVGKRANLVITAGHVLQPTTKVKALFLNGKPVTTETRQTRLFDKYLQRLAEVQAGISPLGIDLPSAQLAVPAPDVARPVEAQP